MLCKRYLPLLAVAVLLAWNTARAAEEPAKEPANKAEAASPADIDKLIEQLDADRFADRQAASQKLALQGKAAIPALAKAAVGESLEVTTRAIDLLRKFHENSDAATKDAAKAALETIAKSDRTSAARRAQEVLKPKADPNTPDNNMVPGGGIIIGGGGAIIQGNIQVGGAAVKKMSVKNANGVREIDVEEGDKKVKIHDDPKNGIKIEVTTKKDGKDVTDKYEAKDAEELKKKHPEGYKVYEEYGKNAGGAGGAIQIQIGGGNIIPAVPGVPVPAGPRIINAGRNDVILATSILRSAISRLERLAKQEGLKDATKESKEELKKQMGEVKRVIADLEKQLQDAEKPAEKATDKPAAAAPEKPADPTTDRAPEKR
jgi:hypothetical protein